MLLQKLHGGSPRRNGPSPLGRGRVSDVSLKASGAHRSRFPSDAVEQVGGVYGECPRQLGQGVNTRNARPSLQQADLGSVKRGAEGEFLLRDAQPLAMTKEIRAEALSDAHGRSRRLKWAAARVGRIETPRHSSKPMPTRSRQARSTASPLQSISPASSGIVHQCGYMGRARTKTAR